MGCLLCSIIDLCAATKPLLHAIRGYPPPPPEDAAAAEAGEQAAAQAGEPLAAEGAEIFSTEYTRALATLSCFLTPGCYPNAACLSGGPSQKVPRPGKAWEEQGLCARELEEKKGREGGERCLVYSFGIFDSWEWEEQVAALFGCDVHAFDPTMSYKTDLAPGVTFHKLGLAGAGVDVTTTHGAEYAAVDKTLVLSLDEIKVRLGHAGRPLDVLMMDCEGCEWGVLKQLACGNMSASQSVGQLVLELHFQKNLGIETPADVFLAADAVTCLQQQRWVINSIERSGVGPANIDYAPGFMNVVESPFFLAYVGMQRVPENQPMPATLAAAYGDTVRRLDAVVSRLGSRESAGKDPEGAKALAASGLARDTWVQRRNRPERVYDELEVYAADRQG